MTPGEPVVRKEVNQLIGRCILVNKVQRPMIKTTPIVACYWDGCCSIPKVHFVQFTNKVWACDSSLIGTSTWQAESWRFDFRSKCFFYFRMQMIWENFDSLYSFVLCVTIVITQRQTAEQSPLITVFFIMLHVAAMSTRFPPPRTPNKGWRQWVVWLGDAVSGVLELETILHPYGSSTY